MDEEMVMLETSATWELVALPKDKKTVRCKWVYKIKHNNWIYEQIPSKIGY